MANDHPDNRTASWNPRVHERANAGLRQKDLIARTADRHVGMFREPPLVRSPSQLGWRRALLVEALDRPRVDEFVDRLGLRGYLRIAFRDVNHLGAGRLTEPSERSVPLTFGVGDELLERRAADARRGRSTALEHGGGNLEQCSFREMADKARVRAVIDDGGRTRLASRIE